jgi:hypothetical protein
VSPRAINKTASSSGTERERREVISNKPKGILMRRTAKNASRLRLFASSKPPGVSLGGPTLQLGRLTLQVLLQAQVIRIRLEVLVGHFLKRLMLSALAEGRLGGSRWRIAHHSGPPPKVPSIFNHHVMPFLIVVRAPELIRRAWRMDCHTIKGMALRQTVDDLLRWRGL